MSQTNTSSMMKVYCLFGVFLFFACSPKVIVRDAWGGGFGSVKERQHRAHSELQVGAVPTDILNEKDSVSAGPKTNHTPLVDTGKKANKYNILNGRYPLIDTIPPDSLMNGADSMLLSAQKDFTHAERNRNRKSLKVLCLLILAYLGVLGYKKMKSSVHDPYIEILAVFLLTVFLILFLLFLGLVYLFIHLSEKIRRRIGIGKIIRAPEKAPTGRRIEYEVRTLLMLNKFMTRRKQLKKISIIRDLSQTDRYNPWLGRLKELKYYKESLKKP